MQFGYPFRMGLFLSVKALYSSTQEVELGGSGVQGHPLHSNSEVGLDYKRPFQFPYLNLPQKETSLE